MCDASSHIFTTLRNSNEKVLILLTYSVKKGNLLIKYWLIQFYVKGKGFIMKISTSNKLALAILFSFFVSLSFSSSTLYAGDITVCHTRVTSAGDGVESRTRHCTTYLLPDHSPGYTFPDSGGRG